MLDFLALFGGGLILRSLITAVRQKVLLHLLGWCTFQIFCQINISFGYRAGLPAKSTLEVCNRSTLFGLQCGCCLMKWVTSVGWGILKAKIKSNLFRQLFRVSLSKRSLGKFTIVPSLPEPASWVRVEGFVACKKRDRAEIQIGRMFKGKEGKTTSSLVVFQLFNGYFQIGSRRLDITPIQMC